MSKATDALLRIFADGQFHELEVYATGFNPAHFHYLAKSGLIHASLTAKKALVIATAAGIARIKELPAPSLPAPEGVAAASRPGLPPNLAAGAPTAPAVSFKNGGTTRRAERLAAEAAAAHKLIPDSIAEFHGAHGQFQSYTEAQIASFERDCARARGEARVNVKRKFFGDPEPGRVA